MTHGPIDPKAGDSHDSTLRVALMRDDAVIGSVTPVLRHLLLHDDQALFGDDILARLRAMLADLAAQMAEAAGLESAEKLAAALPDVPGLLGHLHVLALEWQMTQRLSDRLGLDPVLSPLLQALIASGDAEVATRAMKLLAAQARFAQSQRRMQLPLGELPAELAHGVLAVLEAEAAGASAALRARYDESATRLGLIAQVITALGAGALAALAPAHAGVSMFATALAMATTQPRDVAILAMQDGQAARLGLSLRAAGLGYGSLVDAVQTLNPVAELPPALARISAERAAEWLGETGLGAARRTGGEAHVGA